MKRSLSIGVLAGLVLAGCAAPVLQQAATPAEGAASATSQAATPAEAAAVPATAPVAARPLATAALPAKPAAPAPVYVSDEFGVEVLGAHLSAADFVIDVRYKVIDPARATPLLDRQVHPVLVDEKTGARYYVPSPPIVGALRQTNRGAPIAVNKVYFMMFANPDRRLKAGDTVALYLGERRFGNLVVAQ